MTGATLALTGSTGFLGTHLAERLVAGGFRLRVLVRPGKFPSFRAETITGTLADEAALERLVRGADAVIHAAGLTKALRPAEFQAVNVEGTRRLLEAVARLAPKAHVTLVSSLAAREPGISAYAASKAGGEDEARRLVDPARLLILRPPALYGPGDRQTLALFQAARLPLVPLPGSGRERIAVLHAGDAAQGMERMVADRATGLFPLSDDRPEGYSLAELLAEAARAQGRRPRFVAVSSSVLRVVGGVSEYVGRVTNRPALLSKEKLTELLHEDWSVDAKQVPTQLRTVVRGIVPGFAGTVEWYRQAGWL